MPIVKLPGNLGVAISTGTQSEADQAQAIIDARHAFVQKYCGEQGWPTDGAELTIEQIMQIRQQEGWKKPLSN